MKRKQLIVLDGVMNGLAVTPGLALEMASELSRAVDEFYNLETWNGFRIPSIAVVGLGGFGNRVVSYLPSYNGLDIIPRHEGPEYLGLDTDYSHSPLLSNGYVWQHIPLVNKDRDAHLSCDGKPGRARRAIRREISNLPDLKRQLEDKDIILLVAGLGRGAGTGLSQAIAQNARQAGVLIIALVTLPMRSESLEISLEQELQRLMRCADSIITIAQDESMISEHDARACAESRIARNAADIIMSVLRPQPEYGAFEKVRSFFSKAGNVEHGHASVRINTVSGQESKMVFAQHGIPNQVDRVLVSLDGKAGIDLAFVSEQIQQRMGCPPECQSIVQYDTGFNRGGMSKSNIFHFDAHIWWTRKHDGC